MWRLILKHTNMLTLSDSLTQGCIYPIVLPCEGFLRNTTSGMTRFKGNYVRVWHSEDENEYYETDLGTGNWVVYLFFCRKDKQRN